MKGTVERCHHVVVYVYIFASEDFNIVQEKTTFHIEIDTTSNDSGNRLIHHIINNVSDKAEGIVTRNQLK